MNQLKRVESLHRGVAELGSSIGERSNANEAFQKSMHEVRAAGGMLDRFATAWERAEQGVNIKLHRAPKEVRSILDLQLSVHRLQLSAELLSRAGESVSNTVKRLQQMGSN